MPRPSLSVLGAAEPQVSRASVAAVDAPAFVERPKRTGGATPLGLWHRTGCIGTTRNDSWSLSGNVAPVEYEMNYYRSQEGSLEMARLN